MNTWRSKLIRRGTIHLIHVLASSSRCLFIYFNNLLACPIYYLWIGKNNNQYSVKRLKNQKKRFFTHIFYYSCSVWVPKCKIKFTGKNSHVCIRWILVATTAERRKKLKIYLCAPVLYANNASDYLNKMRILLAVCVQHCFGSCLKMKETTAKHIATYIKLLWFNTFIVTLQKARKTTKERIIKIFFFIKTPSFWSATRV